MTYKILKTSFSQDRFLFNQILDKTDCSYNILMKIHLDGVFDRHGLAAALDSLVNRHEILRTAFSLDGDEFAQIVHQEIPIVVPFVDIAFLSEDERRIEIDRLINEEAKHSFNLEKAPLFRLLLIKINKNEHLILFNIHHIIFDGWSGNIFVRELMEVYTAYQENRTPNLIPLAVQYIDFAEWQREFLQNGEFDRQLKYWKTKLEDTPEILNLPRGLSSKPNSDRRGATLIFDIPNRDMVRLIEVSQKLRVTPFMIMFAVFNVLMYRYSGTSDISIGTPVANRNREDVEELIGLFVNTIVIRTKITGTISFSELLSQIKMTMLEAYSYQDLPIDYLVKEINPNREQIGSNPLFQLMMVGQSEPEIITTDDLSIRTTYFARDNQIVDISISAFFNQNGIKVWIGYNTLMFDEPFIRELFEHYYSILNHVLIDSDLCISNIPINFKDVDRLRNEAKNKREQVAVRSKCIHEVFEDQVKKTPDAPAVFFEDETLSFAELNVKANGLAQQLRKIGVGQQDLVAIFLDQSVEVVVSQLAIMKAGAGFLPLDVKYPLSRLEMILEDAKPKVVITKASEHNRLPAEYKEKAVLLDLTSIEFPHIADNLPGELNSPDQLAYCIYTSGSTGKPKGVLVSHRSAVHLGDTLKSTFKWAESWEGVRVGSLASLAFDASIRQLLMMSLGATNCIFPEHVRIDMSQLAKYIEYYRLDIMNFTPSLFRGYTEALELREVSVYWPKVLLLGGEPISRATWQYCATKASPSVFNIYGPTECTVHCTAARILDADEQPNIGFPIANTQIYLLDEDMNQLPVGAI
ncbi:AMP-binding protein, partial [Acinetobacter pittii]|uniref:non-ribosomal peptide synthetase n=1 Tax=Acinetobacter pittii TaxID=48296 RepID=UPI0021D352A4